MDFRQFSLMAENCYVSRFLLAKENNTQSLENSAMASMVILDPHSASLTFSMICEIEAILAWNQQADAFARFAS